ncbi:MAG: 50S ribosomal protein L22 [Candidatus Peribacteraceae bacterium]|nr:50S ribosomal protein L22 [Candidatus Peribacteraceae bacterium]MDD5074933.1 50S ribosomal protein L22 [Candidatus Peribacteraceae bacterium]
MKASLRSVRIAPKKLAVIAQMIRRLTAMEALDALEHTNKKAARIIQALLKSAVANATFNDKQRPEDLVVKTIVVNQAQSYRRGVPMARGRTRPMRKFLSHVEIVLGLATVDDGTDETPKKPKMPKKPKKSVEGSSQKRATSVKDSSKKSSKTGKSSASSDSSGSSVSS